MPTELGSWCRAAQLHYCWPGMGIRVRLHLHDRGRPGLAEVFLDSTIFRAQLKAAGEEEDQHPRR